MPNKPFVTYELNYHHNHLGCGYIVKVHKDDELVYRMFLEPFELEQGLQFLQKLAMTPQPFEEAIANEQDL